MSDRGKPREQYERTYVLLPQDHKKEWAQAVISALWDKDRPTIGSSADDAGVGDLDVRRIIMINPKSWGGENVMLEWFNEWYEGVEVEVIQADTPAELEDKLSDKSSPPSNFPIIGVHDQQGGEWMRGNGLTGWCVVPVYLGTSPRTMPEIGLLAQAGIRVILRLNYSYAVDDGGQGTMPGPDKIWDFEQACVQTIKNNPSTWGFIYCNEMNNSREWPKGYALNPDYYIASYNTIWTSSPEDAKIAPGAIDPYNPGWGDWRESFGKVLNSIGGAEFLAFHCYTHGWTPSLVRSNTRFGDAPLIGVYYDMRVLESQQAIVPSRFKDLLQVVTETNGILQSWPNDGAWVREAYSYFKERGVVGACLFRYNYDDWRFGDKPEVLKALKELHG